MNASTFEGRVLGDRYVLEAPLTPIQTGFSWVWRALDRHNSRRVAVKILTPDDGASEYTEARSQDFEVESKLTCSLSSPHTVKVFEFSAGTLDGDDVSYLFIVMELLEGITLEQLLVTKPQLPDLELALLMQGVAKSLHEAHHKVVLDPSGEKGSSGFIHRDLKAANLFLIEDHGQYFVKVLDYGLAKTLDEGSGLDVRTTTANMVKGTPLYIAPEQIDPDLPNGPWIDLYALGLIAYECLVGKHYYQVSGKYHPDSILPILKFLGERRDIRLPEEFQERALAGIIHKLLRGDYRLRYQSCEELLQDLKDLQRNPEDFRSQPLPSDTPQLGVRVYNTSPDLPSLRAEPAPKTFSIEVEDLAKMSTEEAAFVTSDTIESPVPPINRRRYVMVMAVVALLAFGTFWLAPRGDTSIEDVPQTSSRLQQAVMRQARAKVADSIASASKTPSPKVPETAPVPPNKVEPETQPETQPKAVADKPIPSEPKTKPTRRVKKLPSKPTVAAKDPTTPVVTAPDVTVTPPIKPDKPTKTPDPEEPPRLIIHEMP